jgi:hypothetical protein
MNKEHNHQAAVIRWARQLAKYGVGELAWLHAIPNGAAVSKSQRLWLWAEGVTRGIADLHLPVARHGFHSFYIEMKKDPSAELRKEQEAFAAFCEDNGILWQRHDEAASAIEAIEWYLGLNNNPIVFTANELMPCGHTRADVVSSDPTRTSTQHCAACAREADRV